MLSFYLPSVGRYFVVLRTMINKMAPKVNPALKRTISGISIEIRLKIIYLDTIRFVYLIFDFPWEKLPLKK